VIEFIERISDLNILESSRVYVYDIGDLIIKKYDYNPLKEIKIHNDLDKTGLIPKLITSFKHDYCYYLVVEKIECLDASVRASMKHKFDLCDYHDEIEKIEDEYQDEIEDYEEELAMFNYSIDDIHIGNFGYKEKQLICLDEGCFNNMDMKDFEAEMLR